MENNFYLGIIHYKKKSRYRHSQTAVLYSEDNINYLELESGIWYTTDNKNKEYIERESIIPTDISQYKVDYRYLFSRINEKKPTRTKKIA